jgi:hypothetical protein
LYNTIIKKFLTTLSPTSWQLSPSSQLPPLPPPQASQPRRQEKARGSRGGQMALWSDVLNSYGDRTEIPLYCCYVIMPNVIILKVIKLTINKLNVIMLNIIILNVILLNVILLNVIFLNVIKLNVTILNVIQLNVILRIVRVDVIMLFVMAPLLGCMLKLLSNEIPYRLIILHLLG